MEFDIPVAASKAYTFATQISAADSKAAGIDKEARLMTGVLLCRVGEAKGWGYSIEASFLTDMLKFVKKNMSGRLQCNMGHRWDANFFQLGRFDKLRLAEDGKAIVADLTVYDAADKSPVLAGMANWFLDIADEDSEAVMCSINGSASGFYQYDAKGNKVYVEYSYWSGPRKRFEEKPVFAEFKDITSCDIVDNGALTDNLFSFSDRPFAQHFAQIIAAPGFMEFFKENEDNFPELQNHFQHKYKFSFPKIISQLFSNQKIEMEDPKTPTPVTPSVPVTAAPPAQEPQAPAVPDVSALITAALKPLQDEIASLKTQLGTTPAAVPTGVKDDSSSRTEANTGQSWKNDPINAKARSFVTEKASA